MKNPSLLWKYIQEREGKEVVEIDGGFALYELGKDYIYLSDIYVEPNKRRTRLCYDLADKVSEIGKEHKCKWLLGTVDPKDPNKDRSKQVLENYGYTFSNHVDLLDWYKKEL